MAKEVGEDTRTSKGISKSYLVNKLMPRVRSAQGEIDDKRSVLSELSKEAIEDHNLHPVAFSILKRLDKIHRKDAAKLTELWFQLTLYVEHMGWMKDQPDMLADRQTPGGGEEQAEAEAEPDNGVVHLSKMRALDDDADLRPRHLRTGSADPDPNLCVG